MTTTATDRRELFTIDALRGAAAVGVLLHHSTGFFWRTPARLDSAMAGERGHFVQAVASATHYLLGFGNMYVALFFVISGFCIHLPYAGATARKMEVGPFLIRRLLRLYPAYVVAILLGFAMLVAHTGHWGVSIATTPNLIGHLLFWPYSNDVLNSDAFYVTPVVWSVIVEVHLYVLYLIAWPLIRRGFLRPLTVILVAFGLAYHAAYQVALLRGHDWPACLHPFAFAPARFGEWLIGAWIADAYRNGTLPQEPRRIIWLPVMGFIGLVLGNALMTQLAWELHTPDVLFSLSFACIVIWCVVYETVSPPLIGRVWAWAVTVGHRSYSLYLCHFSILAIVGEIAVRLLKLGPAHKDDLGGSPTWLLVTIGGISAAVIVTECLYRLVERPSHHLARKLGRRHQASPPKIVSVPTA